MNVVKFAIENPVKIAVGVILVVLFGFASLFEIPIQLTPTVDRPVITVTTRWIGASPQEIEREIVDRQEDHLKNVNSLEKMTSTSTEGEAVIRLEFPVGVDKEVAFRQVSDKLRQVTDYPDEVDQPIVQATDTDMEGIIAWMILSGDRDVAHLKTFIEEQVKPILERAEGVSEVPIYGGWDREVQIEVDPYVLAAKGLTLRNVESAIRRQNVNVSAGTIAQGKLDYSYRAVGEYRSIAEIESTVIAHREGGPIFVRDVAKVQDGFAKAYAFVRSNGKYVIAMPARREAGANVLKTMESLREKIDIANREILGPRGLSLSLTQVYDETTYIWSAIDLVINNILSGGLLAIVVLWLFLRSGGATGIIALAIPISIIGSFLVIAMMGRTLNVILLAGLAFAVGMLVDNAIVVLENIDRHHALGKTKFQAALDGGKEVWGAVLASSLTTMIVFLPVMFIQEEVGQLFKDIAIAITAAIGISMLVAILVVPPLAARFLRHTKTHSQAGEETAFYARWTGNLVTRVNRRSWSRLAVVVGFSLASLLGTWWLIPPTDYLPAGNENLVFGFLATPPGYSLDEFRALAELVEDGDPNDPTDGIRPLWEAERYSPEAARLEPVVMSAGPGGAIKKTVIPPPIEDFFFVAFNGVAFMGCTSKDANNVAPLVDVLNRAGGRIPGAFTFFWQNSLFGGGSSGNSMDLEIRGENHQAVVSSSSALLGAIMQAGYGYPSPNPANFALGRPEVQLVADRTKAAHVGLDVRDVGFLIESCVNGAFVGEFNDFGDRVDMVLKMAGTAQATVEEIGQIPIVTPTGHVLPIVSVADFRRTTAPQQINHIEEMDSVTLSIRPKPGVPLQAAMEEIQTSVIAPLRESGAVPSTVITSLAGTASKLTQTWHALVGDFSGKLLRPRLLGMSVGKSLLLILGIGVTACVIAAKIGGRRSGVKVGIGGALLVGATVLALNPTLAATLVQSRAFLAVLINYLLMAALFESFAYPFLIMFSVPFGMIGGFAALRILHETSIRDVSAPDQQFDVLTMLGFIILLGVVVNNAILLVHQSLNFMKDEGLSPHAAVEKSVRTRTRPILMTTLTTIFGLVPLTIMTGPGSELYRGLGAVQLGGLLISTAFTLIVVPAVFTLFLDAKQWLLQGATQKALAKPVTAAPVFTAQSATVPQHPS
ncbi:MAG: efflux RND transporter permease subunit [Planctomycetota bacterium]